MTRDLLRRAQNEGNPIIRERSAILVWQGRSAPKLIGDFNDWELGDARTLDEVASGVWAYTFKLPRDAYMEYALVRGEKRVRDPLNPRTTPNGIGDVNHFFYMPDAAPTPLARRVRGVPSGTLTRHTLEAPYFIVGGRRVVYLYQPPVTQPCPLVVVFDGPDYLRRARLVNQVDNLIAQKRIRPIALAMLANSKQARMIEYSCSDVTLGFILYCVLPLARRQLNLVDVEAQPGVYGALGASLGGLISLYVALRAPRVFGHVLSQSGAFSVMEHDFVVHDLVRHAPVAPINVWMDAGAFEWLLPANRRMRDELLARGYAVTYREYSGGHNYPAWRDDVWRGLEHLYGKDTYSQ